MLPMSGVRARSPLVCDLEQVSVEEVAAAIDGSDAVVFAAGAGPGSGAERKVTMDRDGAIKLLRAATASGVGRYVMVSGPALRTLPVATRYSRSICEPRRRPTRR